jgi:hypothetical protein
MQCAGRRRCSWDARMMNCSWVGFPPLSPQRSFRYSTVVPPCLFPPGNSELFNTLVNPDAVPSMRMNHFLYVVPGSHRDPRTAAQRALSNDSAAPADQLAMPGAIGVHLRGKCHVLARGFLSSNSRLQWAKRYTTTTTSFTAPRAARTDHGRHCTRAWGTHVVGLHVQVIYCNTV